MLCPACLGDTPDGKRFCANCGAALAAVCPTCGAPLLAGKSFCADCGTPVSPPRQQAEPGVGGSFAGRSGPGGHDTAPVAERRICSVLFVDLVGFTPLAEKRDPEQIRELLSLYFDRAQTIIGHYGGTVEKFIGDAVMAVWGAPIANEDDAERAVRAALEVVASVGDLGRASGLPELTARGGVVTGEVAVTIGRVSEGMVLGDTVNSASRVQSVANPGTVLVDESTWRGASDAIAFTEVGDLTLKGKQEPVRAWQALRVVAQRKGVGRAERLEPPFVGRDEELRQIKELLHATVRERRARLVSVTGVPGIGKSRLAWEFLKYVDGLADNVHWHEGRSPAYGEGITFWALSEMVRMRAGITEADETAAARAKLAASVERFVPDPEERRWIQPRLGHLLGLADAPTGEREELFSAWRTFFERIADVGPTVMVFEDLQWSDPGLIDFIESILEWSRAHPILVVTLARPELADRRPTWGAGQRSFTSLHLDPLSDEAMRDLLGGFVEGLPGPVAEQVRDRSQGVPLYAVEIVRTLVDRGVLVAGAGGYTVTGDLGPLEIPETLQALISSRLDSLPAHQRALLQDAAVLGTTFSAEALAAVHGTATSALEGDLRDLVRKEFLALDTDPRSPERGHYGFVQGLIQEVASSRLARRDRSAKHLAVAHYYEELHDDELTAAVAAHYVAGFRAMPEGPQADEVAAAARDWLSRAGARALSLGSPEQALAFLDQALEVTTGRDRTPLLELAAEAAIRSANYSRAVPMLEEALSLSETDADTDAAARTSARLARALTGDRRYSEAITCVERVWPAARDGHDNRLRAELACEIAGAFTHAGTDGAASLEWAETALQNAERINDSALLARAIGTRSLSLFNQGRRREAAILARGMAALADEAGDLREQALARMGLSVFALYDDPRSSVTVALESADMARRAGQRHIEFTNLLNAAETSVYLGSWDDTRRALDAIAARDIPSDSRTWVEYIRALLAALTGDVAGVLERFGTELPPGEADVDIYATYLTSRAMARLAAGDLEGARADASRGVAKNPLGINSPMCLAVQIRASSWLRDAAGTRAALEGLRGFVGRWVEAVSLTAEASLAALEGDVGRAAETFRRCFDSWKVLDSPLDLALAQLSLVILLGPDHPEAAVAKEARDIFTELGAGPFLARLDDASRGAAAAHARPLQS